MEEKSKIIENESVLHYELLNNILAIKENDYTRQFKTC
jgi:hypothetical protein